MKKRVLAILLAAAMLLSENSVIFAADETLDTPVQANVLDETENPEAAPAETEEFLEEDFTESQASNENVSENQFDYEANALDKETIPRTEGKTVSNNIDKIDDTNTISVNDTSTDIVQAENFAESQATDEKIVLLYEINEYGEIAIRDWQDIKDYEYHPDDKKYICTNGMIPADIKGHPVTKISGAGFQGCSLTQITIPDSVHIIEGYTFTYCENLTSITLPKSITEIDTLTFGGCTSLTQVELPDSICKIGEHAFSNCTKLASITIPKGVTEIAPGTFRRCSSLTQITIPDSVHLIGEYAFESTGFREIKIPGTVKKIMDFAFKYCDNLEMVEIESGVEEIGNSAFYGCGDLETVILPKSVTKLAKNTFDSSSIDLIIKGYTGSYAEKYAKENHITFIPIDPIEQTAFTVTFDKNASKASLASNKRTKKVEKGKTYGALPTPSWSGYYFLGWYTAKSGGSKVTGGTKVALKKNQTLYAHWAKADLTKAKISVKNCIWNSKAQKPKVTITLQGATLSSGKDYTLSYSNNKNPGKGKVTVKGKGIFAKSKTKTAYFTISKAAQTITAKNAAYKASDKGRTITLKASVKGGAKLTYASSKNNQIRVTNKNSGKLKLQSPGAATITIRAAETKYYKAATKKVTVVLQGAQSISLTSRLLSYNKTTKTYALNKEIFNQSIGVSVRGGAKYICSVINSGKTTAWFGNGDRLTARGQGNITVTVQAEKTKDGVYPAAKKSFTILVKGMPIAGDWSYQQSSNGSLTLLKYLGSASEVTVPNTFTFDAKSFKVTTLGDRAFENQPIKKVTIQEGPIVTIGKAAFKNCASLLEIQLNSKTKSIGEEAFYGCRSLTGISLPEGLKTLPANLMKGCTALEGNIYLPEKLTFIGNNAFEGCSNVRKFVIHSYLTNVGDNAFKNCSNVKTVYFSGCRDRWNGVRIGQGNDILNRICCNAGGDPAFYSAINISKEDLYYKYPQYLSNEGFDTITRNLEGDMMTIMAGHTELDTVVAAIKSATMEGTGMPVYCLKKIFLQASGGQYLEEEKVNLALALELVTEAAELSPTDALSYPKIYSIIKEYKSAGKEIFTRKDTRDQLASRLAEVIPADGWQENAINKMLETAGSNDNWKKLSNVFQGAEAASTAGNFLMTFITLNLVGQEPLDRLYERLPENSRLHNGIEQLRNHLNQPLETLMAEFIGDAMMDECLKFFPDSTVIFLDNLWNYNPENFSSNIYFIIAGTMYKLIGNMMLCPTIEQYNNAWVSLGNASVLYDEMTSLRTQLKTAAQNGILDENLQKDYELLMTMYLVSLKKAAGYVASTMRHPGPESLNARFARYEQTLNYNNYLLYCKSQI